MHACDHGISRRGRGLYQNRPWGVAIFNCNTLGQSDYVSSAQDWEHLAAKAAAFGARTEIIDGHDPAAIEQALRIEEESRPLAVIARTVKGWGVPSLGGTGHHGTSVKQEALAGVLAELNETARPLGVTDIGAQDFAALTIEPPAAAPAARATPHEPPGFGAALANNPAFALAKKLSPRRAYGMALAAPGDANEAVVALDADVKNSTYAEPFAKAHPDRYFEARIAEQNMVSVAAGLAAAGKIAFVSTFGPDAAQACADRPIWAGGTAWAAFGSSPIMPGNPQRMVNCAGTRESSCCRRRSRIGPRPVGAAVMRSCGTRRRSRCKTPRPA